MRILYIDIDSLRPDHLGCYGYHRKTSPNIDRIAEQGVVVSNLYASDTPCLPSRTAFFGGRFGSSTGVINHGGVCADLQPQGRGRDFRSAQAQGSLASLLTRLGYRTASISPFPRRHSAYQMTYGFHETVDTGRGGLENANEIFAEVERWLKGWAEEDNWFLHVNMWDPHTPYDSPASFGNPFDSEPIDGWITEEILQKQRASYGPHSAREVPGYDSNLDPKLWLMGKGELKNLEDCKAHIDGYDCGVAYADLYVGRILNLLADHGVLDETAVIVSADHGENLGELNIWGDHQTADEFTNHIPAVVKWPGVTSPGTSANGFFYHLDLAAAIVELAGEHGRAELTKAGWQSGTLAAALGLKGLGRDQVFLSQGAWSLQRSVRWDRFILIYTLNTGLKDFSEWMLFDIKTDPHQTSNLATQQSKIVDEKGRELTDWFRENVRQCPYGDPFDQVQREGGPFHARVNGPEWVEYLSRLSNTGRGHHSEWLRIHGSVPRPTNLATF